MRREWDARRNLDLLALLRLCIPKLLPCARYGLFVLDADGQTLWLEDGTGVMERAIEVGASGSMVGEAIRTRAPVIAAGLEDAQGAHDSIGRAVGFVVTDALTVPILSPVDGRPVGALQVLNRLEPEAWNEAEAELLMDIGHSIVGSVAMMQEGQHLLHAARDLDERIAQLDQTESAIRGGHMLRTFEPAQPVAAGGFLHGRCQGTMYPPFIDTHATEDLAESWDCDANDVFLCTHQKVGTHLAKKYLVETVRFVLGEREDSIYATGDIGHGTMPWPEVMVSQHGRAHWEAHLARSHNQPRLWYIHCSYADIPIRRIHPRARFLVVYRDPKAVAVSQYFFWKRHPLLDVPQHLDLDSFVERFLEGDLYFGDYHDHVTGWLDRPDSRIDATRVLALSYEEMVERKLDCARAIARFVVPTTPLSEDTLATIAATTGFDAMKSEITRNPQSFHLNPSVYFRAGKKRDWAHHLSDLSVAAIDAKTRQVWGGDAPRLPEGTLGLDDML
jgi:hypothetical protein